MSLDLVWSPRPREIDHHLELLPFPYNCSNSCCLLTRLLGYLPVAHPSLVQVYYFIPDFLTQLSGLGHCGEVGVCLMSVWTGVFYTDNEFKQVQLIQWRTRGPLKEELTDL
ncbi:hypothetical protein ILYODFUR_037682 [Ilyodon furcidens]|uniref:Uncharacterized protein n=1 Tax=Ilyodon furcidens TaxID=33524 RepID=A0ABV0U2W8_9TELE